MPIDLETIREKNEGRKRSTASGILWGRETDFGESEADIDALLAEVERLRNLVRTLNPCPHCRTLNLVRRIETARPEEETSGAVLLPDAP